MKNSYKYLISAVLLIAVVCLTVPQTVSAEDHLKSSSEAVVTPEITTTEAEPTAPQEIQCPPGFILVNFELSCGSINACIHYNEIDGGSLMDKYDALNYLICGVGDSPS